MVCPPWLVFLALPGPLRPCEVVECLTLLPTMVTLIPQVHSSLQAPDSLTSPAELPP